jgi:ABC-type bacteriocin/lantibiotic exporter with double-glycine peptidase domain
LLFKFVIRTRKRKIENIDLKIAQGEKIVVEGENGSGKTTLIRILSGLIQPTNGHFIINNDSLHKMDINQYRPHFGSILQGEMLFEGTILENLTFNNPNISTSDIKWTLDNLKLTNFIKTLPNGLNTIVFPDGKQLSSSNIQKILLARCILCRQMIFR